MADFFAVLPSDAEKPLVLALDVGTSSARALVYDSRARPVEGWEVHRRYEVATTPQGGAELDAVALADTVAGCIDDVLSACGSGASGIAAVSSSVFWHSLVGLDSGGDPLTPVYTWADTRSRSQARQLVGSLDMHAVHARTGAVLHSSYWPAKLLWLQQTQPKLSSRVHVWVSFAEFLYLRFLGTLRVSISMASGTGLFDQWKCAWDSELMQSLNLSPQSLSDVVDYSESMCGPTPSYARRWPALADLPWYLPLGDGACNNLGSGGTSPARAVAMLGTSGAMRVVRDAGSGPGPWGLWTYRVDARRVIQGGALSDGGNVFAWLEHTLRLDTEAELETELLGMSPDQHGLTVLPYLAGERSPNWNVDARSAIVGMTLNTRPIDIARAFLESVTYAFAEIYQLLLRLEQPPDRVIGSGGGLTRSPALMQIMTDVLGTPIVTSGVPEASSRGAAMMALEAMGTVSDVSSFDVILGKKHVPRPEHTRRYGKAIGRQHDLYAVLLGDAGRTDAQHTVVHHESRTPLVEKPPRST